MSPNAEAENIDNALFRLGPDARRIANVLIGRLTGLENENDKTAAEAIKQWAKRKRCDHWHHEVCEHCEEEA